MYTTTRLIRRIIPGMQRQWWLCLLLCVGMGTHLSALEADVSVTKFRTPDQAYAEMFLYILGSSLSSIASDSIEKASVAVTYYITEDSVVVAGDHYNLFSEGVGAVPDFMDLRRHVLHPGTFIITVELTDNRDSLNTLTLSKTFSIDQPVTTLSQSDIELLADVEASQKVTVWVRNGQRMTPLPYDWYREEFETLYFYNELYHTDVEPGNDFYISYRIFPSDARDRVLLQGYKRMKPQTVNSILQAIDIKGLSSGEYVLEVGVYDQSKTLLHAAEKVFVRSNPSADDEFVKHGSQYFDLSFAQDLSADSVRYALRAIAPVISQVQVPVLNYLLQKGELENQQRFLHQFFVERDPRAPEKAYHDYMRLARIVDKEFHSAFGYGFETDRGRIFLKYGTPDDIIEVSDEPSAPPYAIWIYNDFPQTNQSNVRFLFYNPSLAGGDYRLLHSTAIGEIHNSRWQQDLYRSALSETQGGDYIDARDVQDNWHRRAVEYFKD